ncbi:MAG: BadF/BadG/BcrA/BcrD ATPase family protein [Acidobacteriota bacterium]
MLTRTQEFFIGVDGGGTKTCAVVIDNESHVLGEARTGTANPLVAGFAAAAEAIERAIREAVAAARISLNEVASTYLGIAGVEHPESYLRLCELLCELLPGLEFHLATDAWVALAGATDLQPGIVIISGTGSIAFGRNSRGEEARAGGWGSTIGDEGSGYYIARGGLAAVAKSYDGRGSQTLIADILRKRAGVRTPIDLQRIIYYPFANNSAVAAYCGIVVEAARAGDLIARDILAGAGRELGLAVTAVIRRLSMETEVFPVAYVGGTFQAGELLLDPMRLTIEQIAPRAILQPPRYSPVLGAARLAMQRDSLRKSA